MLIIESFLDNRYEEEEEEDDDDDEDVSHIPAQRQHVLGWGVTESQAQAPSSQAQLWYGDEWSEHQIHTDKQHYRG